MTDRHFARRARGHFRNGLAAVAGLIALAAPLPALAQESVGTRLADIIASSWGPVLFLIAAASMLLGLFLVSRGLVHLVRVTSEGGRNGTPISAFVMIACGVLMIALPDTAGVGLTTWAGNAGAGIFGGDLEATKAIDLGSPGGGASNGLAGAAGVQQPDDCFGSDDPVVCMARNVAKNAVPVGVLAIFALVFLTGLLGFASCLKTWASNQAQGGGGRDQGIWTKLVVSVLFMNAPFLYYTVANTLLGASADVITADGFNSGSSLLSYHYTGGASGKTAELLAKWSELIGYCFQILALFGAWAFVRGINGIKGAAEGRSQNGYGTAFVYIVAGILLANAKVSTCMVTYTMGGSGMTLGFCN
jgi:hypothetical protein